MKICTITCNNAVNHGARLQTYALYRYLSDLGHEVKVIDYAPDYIRFDVTRLYNPGFDPKQWARLVYYLPKRINDIRQHRKMEDFSRRHITTTGEYSSLEELEECPPEADAYIAGSDQIWNCSLGNGRDPAFYLGFGDDNVKRLSYAASIAISDIPTPYRMMVSDHLRRFSAISVREDSAVHILKDMGFDSSRVCDPVFLLDAGHWSREVSDDTGQGEKYLLVYDFEGGRELREVATRIASLRGLKIFSVSQRRLGYAQRNYLDCGPETFVGLIKNAKCVLSNSLHGTIFSLIYGKDFYLVKRADGLNLRMTELLQSLSLSDRVVDTSTSDDDLTLPVDYRRVTPMIESMVSKSKQWLADNLA